MCAAAGDDDSLNGSFADVAVGVGSSVDAVLKLEEAFATVGVNVIGDGGAAEGDGFLQDGLDGGVESLEFVASELASAASRTDPSAIEGFVGVDVADSVKQLLIEESCLDWRVALAKEADE